MKIRHIIHGWLCGAGIIALCGCEPFGGSDDGIEIDDRYREQCVAELISATAKLAAQGYKDIGDDPDKVVEVRQPERQDSRGGGQIWLAQAVLRNGQWEGMWIGGNWTMENLMVVAQPDGAIRAGRFEHEWAHEILYRNKINFSHHHGIMRKAGIHGS